MDRHTNNQTKTPLVSHCACTIMSLTLRHLAMFTVEFGMNYYMFCNLIQMESNLAPCDKKSHLEHHVDPFFHVCRRVWHRTNIYGELISYLSFRMQRAMNQLAPGSNIKMTLSEEGSGRGAAIVAAVACRLRDAEEKQF